MFVPPFDHARRHTMLCACAHTLKTIDGRVPLAPFHARSEREAIEEGMAASETAAPTGTPPSSQAAQSQGVAAFINKVWSILANEEYNKLISWSEVRPQPLCVCRGYTTSKIDHARETFVGCALIGVSPASLSVRKERDSPRLPQLFQGNPSPLLQTQQLQ